MELCVIGSGHVGLVTGACFADLGHNVICVDQDETKIKGLRKGKVPFYEPGLAPMVAHAAAQKRLSFTTRISEGVKRAKVIFIAVGTPPLPSGEADLSSVEQVVRQIARSTSGYCLIVEKSTVPVETGKQIAKTLAHLPRRGAKLDVASNPEFLREGSAVNDFLRPDRIVIGVESDRAKKLLTQLYKPLGAPLVVTDIASAELIKHASNAFLSTKISFINAISVLCDRVGADVEQVARGMGLDPRIGSAFLRAGAGYGGFCFPKDLEAFIRIAEKLGYDFKLLKATKEINEGQPLILLDKIRSALWNLKGKTIGILGLAFKPDTDDLRFAPSLGIIKTLLASGAKIKAFDPQAMTGAKKLLGTRVKFAKDPYALARGSDCLVVVTEWDEFGKLDLKRVKRLMRHAVIVDGRNLFDSAAMRRAGFRYTGMGRRGKG